MKLTRRTLLRSVGALAAASHLPAGLAQTWTPTQPVKMICPFPPGGAADLSARNLSPKLAAASAQPVVVENKTGAGGAIGAVAAARSAPDGHTLLLHTISMAIQPSLIKDPGYNLTTDFTPITMLMTAPLVLLVHPSVPATTVPELIQYARAKGDNLFFGSAGNGSAQHLVGEMFNRMAGTKIKHVPFRGNGPATTALLGGEIQVFFDIIPTAQSFVPSGKLRALATTGRTPSSALPNLPTVMAAGGLPEFEFTLWQGLFLPKGGRACRAVLVERHQGGIGRQGLPVQDQRTGLRNRQLITGASGGFHAQGRRALGQAHRRGRYQSRQLRRMPH